MNATPAMPSVTPSDVTEHPLVHDINQEAAENLTPIERFC